ncbi:hypothetical protein B5P41_31005, partial [Bacillus sp. SRB_28]
ADGGQLAVNAAEHRLRLPLQPAGARAHTGGDAARQVAGNLVEAVAQRVDHADSRNVDHLSHPGIEW